MDTAEVAEIWNPDTRQFRQVATARTPRLYHSNNILLPDATVLVSGGGAPGPVNNLNGELYYPPYLFDVNGNYAQRLSIGTIGEKFGYNDNTNVPYFGAGRVKRVTLIRNGAVTHSFNVGQRFLELSFTEHNGSVQVIMPNSPNIAPPGYYMLFLVNEAGVPSIAKIINLNNGQTAGPSQPQPESQPQTQPQTQPEEQPNVFVQRNLVVGEIYMVRSKASAKCMDVAAQGSDNGIAVQQYECNKTAAQSFRLIQNQNGGLSLANLNSNKCIDLAGVSKDNGGLVHQWDCLGTPNQTLNFAPQSDGSFQIRFAHSDRCLDVPAFSADNSVRLQQWDCGTGANQGFYLLK
ncbi:MAG: DUF1929 domain-containing protein [Proteobacteria bacterium]|nr:MAG: DUF1929 domain-containing protein [Pseudomonadota bacterium]